MSEEVGRKVKGEGRNKKKNILKAMLTPTPKNMLVG
jgi:hypothetical protein